MISHDTIILPGRHYTRISGCRQPHDPSSVPWGCAMIPGGPLMDGIGKHSRTYRRALVDTLRRGGQLKSDRVAAAMLAVPRELFVPGVPLADVYRPSD